MFNANPVELIIIGVLLIIFFGQDKLASTAKNLGQSFRVFKKELSLEESSPKAQTANSSVLLFNQSKPKSNNFLCTNVFARRNQQK
jgi:TatA/E family protein of Tat protein translocase